MEFSIIFFYILNEGFPIKGRATKVNLIEPVLEGSVQLFFQSIILYMIYGPGSSKVQSILVVTKQFSHLRMNVLGRPFDLRSLLASSNNSVPYFYFLLLTSTVISVGISHARLLTKGKKPILTEILSVKFLKINLMLISKFMVQSYFVSIAVQSLMFKFVSKEGLTSKITLT